MNPTVKKKSTDTIDYEWEILAPSEETAADVEKSFRQIAEHFGAIEVSIIKTASKWFPTMYFSEVAKAAKCLQFFQDEGLPLNASRGIKPPTN